MSHWKNQDDLAESKRLAREENKLYDEMLNKRQDVAKEYQAKIDIIKEKRFELQNKNT